MKGHIIGYVRVSTYDQNPDRQLEGIETDKIFTGKPHPDLAPRERPNLFLPFRRLSEVEFDNNFIGVGDDVVYFFTPTSPLSGLLYDYHSQSDFINVRQIACPMG